MLCLRSQGDSGKQSVAPEIMSPITKRFLPGRAGCWLIQIPFPLCREPPGHDSSTLNIYLKCTYIGHEKKSGLEVLDLCIRVPCRHPGTVGFRLHPYVQELTRCTCFPASPFQAEGFMQKKKKSLFLVDSQREGLLVDETQSCQKRKKTPDHNSSQTRGPNASSLCVQVHFGSFALLAGVQQTMRAKQDLESRSCSGQVPAVS